MSDRVVKGFFYGEQKVVAGLRLNRDGRKVRGDLKPIVNPRWRKKSLDVIAQKLDKVGEGIVTGVGRPDDFVSGVDELTHAHCQRADFSFGSSRDFFAAHRQFALQRDAGEASAQFIVKV